MSTPKAETGDGAARDKMKQFLRPLWMMVPQIVKASVVSHKQLDLFSLIFSHSWTRASRLDPLQGLFAPAEFLED